MTTASGSIAITRAVQVTPALFQPATAGSVALSREGTSYWMWQSLGSGRFWCQEMADLLIGDAQLTQLRASEVRSLVVAEDHTTGSTTLSGTWSLVPQVLSYGGSYSVSTTTNSYADYTTPAGSTVAGLIYVMAANGGVCKVSIDGDATRATALKTAQQLVTDGVLLSTALVANGGTLNPTDRCLSMYGGPIDYAKRVLVADDLTAGVHTIRLTCTGYKHPDSGDVRLYFTGWLAGNAAMTLSTSGVSAGPSYNTSGPLSSVMEYALVPIPAGATDQGYLGSGHGYDYQDSIAFTVDGVTAAPADGVTVIGTASVGCVRTSHLRHPDTGTTNIATIVQTLTLNPRGGLRKHCTWTWHVAGTHKQSYVAMWPLTTTLDRGNINGTAAADADLDLNTGLFAANARSTMAYLWDADGVYGALLVVPNPILTTRNWQYATSPALAIEDRANGAWNKIYLARANQSTPEPIAIGDVWTAEVVYLFARFSGGANATLAGRQTTNRTDRMAFGSKTTATITDSRYTTEGA